jgi:hypothetical protein
MHQLHISVCYRSPIGPAMLPQKQGGSTIPAGRSNDQLLPKDQRRETLSTVIQTTEVEPTGKRPRVCLQPAGRLRASGSRRRIPFVDLAELTCNLSIAVCIKESAENRVCLRMHVEASVAFLQRLKFVDRVFIGHHALALRSWEVPAVHLSYGDLTPRPHFCADCFQDGASCKPSRPACKGD